MPTHVLEYLEASALRHPEKTAFADERDSVGYGELLLQSRKIASALGALLPSRSPVAFCTRRTSGRLQDSSVRLWPAASMSSWTSSSPSPG